MYKMLKVNSFNTLHRKKAMKGGDTDPTLGGKYIDIYNEKHIKVYTNVRGRLLKSN